MNSRLSTISGVVIWLLVAVTSGAWGAGGIVKVTSHNTGATLYTSTGFTISGTYLMNEDNSPSGEQYGSSLCSNGHVRFTPRPWDPLAGIGTYAEARYSVDGAVKGQLIPIYDAVRYTRDGYPYGWTNFNTTLNFSANISINGLDPNISHTARMYLQDVWGYRCDNWSQDAYVLGDIFAQDSVTFRICANADNDPFSTCDGDTTTNHCNDNDASIYPGAPELCDKKDNDCDGEVDEGCNPCANDPCCENPDPCKCGSGGGFGSGSAGGSGPAASVGGP